MNVSNNNERTNGPDSLIEDSTSDHFQDIVPGMSLHATDGRNERPPYIGGVGIFIASIEIFMVLGVVAAAFVLPHIIDESSLSHFNSFSLTIYADAVIMLIFLVLDLVLSRHHRKIKLKGFIRFYRSVKYLYRYPFYMMGLFICLLLAYDNYLLFCETRDSFGSCLILSLSPIMWLQIALSLQAAVILIGLTIYIGRVITFNKHRGLPDDAETEMLSSFHPYNLNSSDGVGYRPDSHVDDIIENQADRIRSLQEQNAILNKKLYSLTFLRSQSHPSP